MRAKVSATHFHFILLFVIGLPVSVPAQDLLGKSRRDILRIQIEEARCAWIDTSQLASISARMTVQPVEQYYHFSDTLFSPFCDSLCYGYNCGPCMDDHLGQFLSNEWHAIGNECYVEPRNWVLKRTSSGKTRYDLRTVTVVRTPEEEICGRVIIHMTAWTKAERKGMRRALRK